MKQYKGYLIDLDGTVYRGNEVIESAKPFIAKLNKKDIPYLFVTNNSSKTPTQVIEKLTKMGINTTANHVMTSSLATASYLSREHSDKKVYAIGEQGLFQALKEKFIPVIEHETEQADVVVVGIDRKITYEKLAQACLHIRKGATFLSTNQDAAIPTERGLLPGNGSLTSVLTTATGVQPTFIGKPQPEIITQSLQRLQLPKEDVLMIGDNYHTDILAGIHSDVDTLLVFTGVSQLGDLAHVDQKPTYYAENLQNLL